MPVFGGDKGARRAADEQNTLLQQQIAEQNRQFEIQQQFLTAAEAQRAANRSSALGAITSQFADREPLIQDFVSDTVGLNRQLLQEARDKEAQQLGFSLGRAGTSGGSIDVDKRQELRNTFQDRLRSIQSEAEALGNQFRAQQAGLENQLRAIAAGGTVGSSIASQIPAFVPPAGVTLASGNVPFNLASSIGQAALAAGQAQVPRIPIGSGANLFSSFNPGSSTSRFRGTTFQV